MWLAPLPRGVRVERALADGVPGEWVVPRTANRQRVLYYLHGGGYVIGSTRSYRRLVAYLARAAGVAAFQIDYRRAPEHQFPAAVADSLTAYRWLLQQGVQPEHVAIAGDSAGGGLALATLLALRDNGEPLPAACAVLSPWTDLALTGASIAARAAVDPCLTPATLVGYAREALGSADPRTPLASPLYGDPAGLPPLLVQVGEDEILLDDAARLVKRAVGAGVQARLEVWAGMWHVWQLGAAIMPEADRAIARIAAFVRAHAGVESRGAAARQI